MFSGSEGTNFMEEALIGRWGKKFRALTLALIFSGALNIGLFAALVFSTVEEKSASSPAVREEPVYHEFLAAMSKLSFRELVSFLTNREPVGEGYLKRDLALAVLVAFHDFNLEKALSERVFHRCNSSIPQEREIELFPGFTEEQYQAIVRFAYEEKWPLTSKGLFSRLQGWPEPRDESLVQAFLDTPEFASLQALSRKTAPPQEISPPVPSYRLHEVKEGENLWKIARLYGIKLDELVRLNELEKEQIFPGMTLRIPQGTGSEPPL